MGKSKPVDEADTSDAMFLLPKKARGKVLGLVKKSRRVQTRGDVAKGVFKKKRTPVTAPQRALQREVYRVMPAPTETSLKALTKLGKPCHADLETTSVMPDLHKQAAFVRKEMKTGGSASPIIFKYDQIRKKHAVFALVKESLKYYKLIDQILTDIEFFNKNPKVKNDEQLVHVLVYEMVFGQGLDLAWPSQALEAVQAAHQPISQALYKHATEHPDQFLPFRGLPRYARVNTIKTTLEAVVESLKSAKYKLRNDIKPNRYNELEHKQFTIDPDIPNLLVFAPGAILTGPLLDSGDIIEQDKASCFSAYALLHPDLPGKPLGVLDACAAPGNKTLHLAALLKQTKQYNPDHVHIPLIGIEKDEVRFKVLKSRTYNAYARVHCINSDFLSLDPKSSTFRKITHILVDPSCSGSGIVSAERYAFSDKTLGSITESNTKKNTRQTKATFKFEELPEDYEEADFASGDEFDDMDNNGDAESDNDDDSSDNGDYINNDNGDDNDEDDSEDSDFHNESESDESDTETNSNIPNTRISTTDDDTNDSNTNNNNDNETVEQKAMKFSVQNFDYETAKRVENLRKFQISAIKHALKFPSVRRVVYSTCSIFIEENERVVEEVLQDSPQFKLIKALPNWHHRGFEIFEGGSLCARASPAEDSATGFFVACFERVGPIAPANKGANKQKSPYPSTIPNFPSDSNSPTSISDSNSTSNYISNPKSKSKVKSKVAKITKIKTVKPVAVKRPSSAQSADGKRSKKKRKITPVPIVVSK